jgi:hypothetical protein
MFVCEFMWWRVLLILIGLMKALIGREIPPCYVAGILWNSWIFINQNVVL